jgi:AbrB family looped-hinge helix DNA binding protein
MELEVEGRKIGESKVSQRGSVVVPKAVRIALNLDNGEFLEWFVAGRFVVVRKKEEGR